MDALHDEDGRGSEVVQGLSASASRSHAGAMGKVRAVEADGGLTYQVHLERNANAVVTR